MTCVDLHGQFCGSVWPGLNVKLRISQNNALFWKSYISHHVSCYIPFQFSIFSGRHVVSAVEKFSPSSGTWCAVSPLLTPRRSHGVAMLDGALYAVGGSDGIATLNQV